MVLHTEAQYKKHLLHIKKLREQRCFPELPHVRHKQFIENWLFLHGNIFVRVMNMYSK